MESLQEINYGVWPCMMLLVGLEGFKGYAYFLIYDVLHTYFRILNTLRDTNLDFEMVKLVVVCRSKNIILLCLLFSGSAMDSSTAGPCKVAFTQWYRGTSAVHNEVKRTL